MADVRAIRRAATMLAVGTACAIRAVPTHYVAT